MTRSVGQFSGYSPLNHNIIRVERIRFWMMKWRSSLSFQFSEQWNPFHLWEHDPGWRGPSWWPDQSREEHSPAFLLWIPSGSGCVHVCGHQPCGEVMKQSPLHVLFDPFHYSAFSNHPTSCVVVFFFLSVVRKKLPSGRGQYHIRMIPYQDAGFHFPLSSTSNIEMEIDQRLYVEVRTEGIDGRQISTILDSCWATPVNNGNYPVRWDLITAE